MGTHARVLVRRLIRGFGIPVGALALLYVLWRLRHLPPEQCLAAVGPLLCVYAVDRARSVPGQRLAYVSLVLFLNALPLPALTLGGDTVYGWSALPMNFLAFSVLLSEPPFDGLVLCYLLACLLGAAANLCYGAVWFTRSRRLAALGAGAALAVLIPLALCHKLNGVHLGHGLWLASHGALALALCHPAGSAPAPTLAPLWTAVFASVARAVSRLAAKAKAAGAARRGPNWPTSP
jgi:hypothetical protein